MRENLPRVGSGYALPPFCGDYVRGSIDLPGPRPRALDEQGLERASVVADAVAAALLPVREAIITGSRPPARDPEPVCAPTGSAPHVRSWRQPRASD